MKPTRFFLFLLAGFLGSAQAAEVTVQTPLGPERVLGLCGNGAGLTWKPEQALHGVETSPGSGVWKFALPDSKDPVELKAVILDLRPVGNAPVWESGPNLRLSPGQSLSITDPAFEFPHGTMETHSLPLPGGGERTVRVYRPPGLTSESAPLPVLYALDGQNLFSRDQGENSWKLDLDLDEAIARGWIKPMVAVGIDHAGVRRNDEYLYVKGGAKFATEFFPTVVRWAENESGLKIDPTRRALLGSSLGALEAAYIALVAPGDTKFARLILLSGSFWWNQRDFPVHLKAWLKATSLPTVDLTIGTNEGYSDADHAEALEGVREMKRSLEQLGYQEGKNLLYHEIPGGEHREAAWAAEMRRVLADTRKVMPLTSPIEEICNRQLRMQASERSP